MELEMRTKMALYIETAEDGSKRVRYKLVDDEGNTVTWLCSKTFFMLSEWNEPENMPSHLPKHSLG